jgi:hypothetical protein
MGLSEDTVISLYHLVPELVEGYLAKTVIILPPFRKRKGGRKKRALPFYSLRQAQGPVLKRMIFISPLRQAQGPAFEKCIPFKNSMTAI